MPPLAILAAATVASAGIGAVALSSASKKATKAATNAAADNNALQRDIYSQNKTALSPYIDQGVTNSGKINALLVTNPYEFTADKFTADPGYQFRLNQGLSGVTQNKAVNGLLKSGSALKALNDYAQGGASQEYGAAYNRHEQSTGNYVNALQDQQGVGLSAAGALAGAGTGFANAVSANNNNAANTVGNAALAGANQTNNLLGQGVNALSYATGQGVNALSYATGQGGFGAQRGSSYGGQNLAGDISQYGG